MSRADRKLYVVMRNRVMSSLRELEKRHNLFRDESKHWNSS